MRIGKIASSIPIITSAIGITLSADEVKGTVVLATDAITINLPVAKEGDLVTIYSVGSTLITVNPDNSDKIVLDGTALSNGQAILSGSLAGDFITLVGYTDGWIQIGKSGAWTAGV